jgi:hypothetical protein
VVKEQRVQQLNREATAGEGVLIFDDTGMPKPGTASVGVARQYSGTLGKVGNCQVVVSCQYADACFSWPVTARLYLHEGYVVERMLLRPWSTLLRVGEHPVVVAAPGTHNLYPHDMPKNPDGTITAQWVGEGQRASEPANAFVRDSTESSFAGLFALKVLAGFLLGGPIGALVGGAAAGAEASAAEEEGLYEPPKLDPSPPPESDDPLAEDASDIEKDKIGSPQGIENPPFVDPARSEIREWRSRPEEALVDGSLLLSPYGNVDRPTFSGRWGVRCTSAPFLIRSGIPFPAYRSQIVDALLTQA